MLIQIPPEIDPYIKMHYYNILIPKLGLPDNLKKNSINLTTNNNPIIQLSPHIFSHTKGK